MSDVRAATKTSILESLDAAIEGLVLVTTVATGPWKIGAVVATGATRIARVLLANFLPVDVEPGQVVRVGGMTGVATWSSGANVVLELQDTTSVRVKARSTAVISDDQLSVADLAWVQEIRASLGLAA